MPTLARVLAVACGLGVTALAFLTASLVASVEPNSPAARPFVLWGTAMGFAVSTGYWLLAALPPRPHRFNKALRLVGVVAVVPVAAGCVYFLAVTGSNTMRIACTAGLIATAWLCWEALYGPQ